MEIKIIATIIRPTDKVNFFHDVDLMNYILNEYVYPKKLWPVTELSSDRLTLITTLTFFNKNYLEEFLNDENIKKINSAKLKYHEKHKIISKLEIINE